MVMEWLALGSLQTLAPYLSLSLPFYLSSYIRTSEYLAPLAPFLGNPSLARGAAGTFLLSEAARAAQSLLHAGTLNLLNSDNSETGAGLEICGLQSRGSEDRSSTRDLHFTSLAYNEDGDCDGALNDGGMNSSANGLRKTGISKLASNEITTSMRV